MQGFCFYHRFLAVDNSFQPVHVIDHPPAAATFFNAALPVFKPVHVFARIDIIAAQLGNVKRNNIEAFKLEWSRRRRELVADPSTDECEDRS